MMMIINEYENINLIYDQYERVRRNPNSTVQSLEAEETGIPIVRHHRYDCAKVTEPSTSSRPKTPKRRDFVFQSPFRICEDQ
ncbi:hypothetical protein GPALN_004945 [Globodera pallida]|nr:hypothetical protein GPALN_004945 [Globodera pallida]